MARGRQRRGSEAGLTLVELMITVVVASLVASSTFVFFAGQQRIYETQTKLLNVQQNLWMALEVMSRQIRAAGSGMTGCPTTVPPVGAATPANGVRAFRQGTGVFRIPPLHIRNGAAGAPDDITFSYFTNSTGNYVDQRLSGPVATTYNGSNIGVVDASPFKANEFVMLFDARVTVPGNDRGCSLFQITNVAGGNSFIVNPSSPWNSGGPAVGLVPFDYTVANAGVRNMGTLNSVRYFVAPGSATVAPRLMVDDLTDSAAAQVLAEGIEDMQIAYACDLQPAAPDGGLNEGTDVGTRLTDEWTYNVAGDIPPPACTTPTAIRVTLFGRSLTPDNNLLGTSGSSNNSNSFKAALEDGTTGVPDLFRHRTLTTTIFPRN